MRWMPDGRRVVFTGDSAVGAGGTPGPQSGANSVILADVESGQARVLYSPPPKGPVPTRAEVSPDGRTIYFKAFDAAGRAQIWSVPASGGSPRLLVRFADAARPSNRPDFSVDAKRFYFAIDDRQSDIWIAELVKK